MQIQCTTSMAAITADPAASRPLYVDALGLPLNRSKTDHLGVGRDVAIPPLPDGSILSRVWAARLDQRARIIDGPVPDVFNAR
ncbi:MAG: hypothetical protein GIX01_01740 [Candidatus Eremiobacteraeota bacterium]|nr:hypothetical protein [Candidatus Eremiobacteraeota bacterium]